MSQEEFSRAFKGSPMKRAKLRGLQRNAAVVLGNQSPSVARGTGEEPRHSGGYDSQSLSSDGAFDP
jgi:epoxyqueuosine reductase QueG